jgi:NADH-quinone oxidoreductase subunit J
MNPAIPYVACVVGAAALFLLLNPGSRAMKRAGVVLGLGAFAWLVLEATRFVGGTADGTPVRPQITFLVFSLIAVASAVRMITNPRPVYCALYFVMVVLSSAGLFLLLQAEFMAFALIIVYAGAILITYMFVLMLAHQAPSSDAAETGQPTYDRVPREPGMAATIAFIMLALFTHTIFNGGSNLHARQTAEQANTSKWKQLDLMPGRVDDALRRHQPGATRVEGTEIRVTDSVATIEIAKPGEPQPVLYELPAEAAPTNLDLVGLDLVAAFPVSLELAGVILLLAMFGAVVLARKQIELGEDEVREAAGMQRLGFHADDHAEEGSA